jgi:hypothetical protein
LRRSTCGCTSGGTSFASPPGSCSTAPEVEVKVLRYKTVMPGVGATTDENGGCPPAARSVYFQSRADRTPVPKSK